MRINIKDKMEENKISRYDMAKRIGVTYPTITAIWSSASTSIKLDILESICKELNCTPNDILVSDDKDLSILINNHKISSSLDLANKILSKNGINFDGGQESSDVLDSVAEKLQEYIVNTNNKSDE